MSDTEPERDQDEPETTISGDEGLQTLVDTAHEQEAERERELTAAEKQKRRIMRDRGEVDPTAPPVTVTWEVIDDEDDYQFAFSPMPKKVRAWVENTSFEFVGLDEETLREDTTRGQEVREVKDRTASLLAEHSRAATYDAEFWHDYFGVEERMQLINAVLSQQDAREGNRR